MYIRARARYQSSIPANVKVPSVYLRSSHYEYTRGPSRKTDQKSAPAVVFPGRVSPVLRKKKTPENGVIFLFILCSTAYLHIPLALSAQKHA